ncbi:MAG: hypothetical protein JWQ79_2928 [Mucilaginibacter sp.]|nr:hypothetical protein [Mucilaginibacter sp.]
MKLTIADLSYINQRMEAYPIMYQEIYDEILDHVISAIETAYKNGDQRDIESVFNEIMDTHFGGNKEIRRIVLQNSLAYNKKITKAFWGNFKSYLNWQTVMLIAILIITSFYLPQTKTGNAILLFAVIIASFCPIFYTLFKTKGVKTGKRKRSLARTYVVSISQMLSILTYVILFVFRLVPKPWHLSLLSPLRYSPFIYVSLLCFFVIYTLSVIRLYKQVFKPDEFGSSSFH